MIELVHRGSSSILLATFFLDTLYYLTFALETYFLFVSEYRQVVVWAEYYNIVEKTNSPTAPDTIYVEDVRPQYLPTLCCITFGSPADNTLYAEVRINSHKQWKLANLLMQGKSGAYQIAPTYLHISQSQLEEHMMRTFEISGTSS